MSINYGCGQISEHPVLLVDLDLDVVAVLD
jgi:hypothetical protein